MEKFIKTILQTIYFIEFYNIGIYNQN